MLTPAKYLFREARNFGDDKLYRELSLRQWVPTIIILCVSVWLAPAATLAQQAAPAVSDMADHSSLWSLEDGKSNKTPYLVLGMADREGTASHDSFRNKAATASAENTIVRQNRLAAYVRRTDKVGPDPLVLSSLLGPNAGLAAFTNVHAKPIESGSVSCGYHSNCCSPEHRLANSEFSAYKVVQAPRPFFEVELGGWRLPVMLSGTQLQDSSQRLW
jgi:hypothetical protein